MHIRFVASSQTHPVQPITPIWQEFVLSRQLRLMYCVFSLRKIKAIQLVNTSVIVQTVPLLFFSMPSKEVIIIDNRVYVLGHKYFLGLYQSSFKSSPGGSG